MAKSNNNNNNNQERQEEEEEDDDQQQQWQPQPPLIYQLQTNNVNDGNGVNEDNNNNEIREVPLGYRFCPNDHELLHFLWNKILNRPLPCDRVREVELYRYHPRQLAGPLPLPLLSPLYFFVLS